MYGARKEEREILVTAALLSSAGYGPTAIANALEAGGYRTRFGTPLSRQRVDQILRHQVNGAVDVLVRLNSGYMEDFKIGAEILRIAARGDDRARSAYRALARTIEETKNIPMAIQAAQASVREYKAEAEGVSTR